MNSNKRIEAIELAHKIITGDRLASPGIHIHILAKAVIANADEFRAFTKAIAHAERTLHLLIDRIKLDKLDHKAEGPDDYDTLEAEIIRH